MSAGLLFFFLVDVPARSSRGRRHRVQGDRGESQGRGQGGQRHLILNQEWKLGPGFQVSFLVVMATISDYILGCLLH